MTLLLLGALLLAGVGAWVSRRWRLAGQTMMALGGLGLPALIAWQVRQNLFPGQPKAPNRLEMAASFGLANCLIGDLAGQGGTIVLLFPETRRMDSEDEQNYEDGFLPPLRHGHLTLRLKAVRLPGGNGDALGAFKQALAQTLDAMAVVSYAGVPAGFDTLFPAGQTTMPVFYVFDPDRTTNWLSSLKAGRIRAVVLPAPGVDPGDRKAIVGMPEMIFARFYILATAANADEVAAGLGRHSSH